MRKFETLLLISPELPAEARTATLDTIKAVVEREKGQIAEVDVWGMRDLAYPVQKQQRGYYVRLEYNGPGEIVATDNGDPTDFTVFASAERKAFNGLALVIVKAKRGQTGRILVTAKSQGLAEAAAEVTVR